MPFLNPPNFLEAKINICCKKFNVDIFKGNRMSHLLSKNSNKGKAINTLKKYSNIQNIQIIGLGDSPNDLPLLLNSDIRIVIPGIDGPNLNLLDSICIKGVSRNFCLKNVNILVTILKVKRQNIKNNKKNGNY